MEIENYDQALKRQAIEEKEKKRQQWEDIQEKDRFLADFMTCLSKTFGKLKNVDVVFVGNEKIAAKFSAGGTKIKKIYLP